MQGLNVTALALAAPAMLVLAACSDQPAPTEAARVETPTVALDRKDNGRKRGGTIVARDDCDPATFNAALQSDVACVKRGRTTFNEFIAELQATKVAKDWRFKPEDLKSRRDVDLLGRNAGGEEHTFTPVRHFGGGVVEQLNTLSGNPVVASECLQLEPDDFVESGGLYVIQGDELAAVADASGIARVECCIHPWMRTEVRIKG